MAILTPTFDAVAFKYLPIFPEEVTSAESLSSDFIRDRLACQDSQGIVNHALCNHLTGFHRVGADMGGDDYIGKAEERMVPATKKKKKEGQESQTKVSINVFVSEIGAGKNGQQTELFMDSPAKWRILAGGLWPLFILTVWLPG